MPLEIGSCDQVTDALIDDILASGSAQESVFALLDRMGNLATPEAGAWKVLRVLARAFPADFVTGALEVRLRSDGPSTVVDTFVHDGDEVSRLFPPIHVAVPLSELREAVSATPDLVLPLTLADERGDGFRMRTPKKARSLRPRSKMPSEKFATVKRDSTRQLATFNATLRVPVSIPAEARPSQPPGGIPGPKKS